MTVIESVPEALALLRLLLTGPLGLEVPAWLKAAEQAWARPVPGSWLATRRVAVPVWRDPWIVVGARTFTGDVLTRLGLDNVLARARTATRTSKPGRSGRQRPTWSCCPTSPTPSPRPTARRSSPPSASSSSPAGPPTWYGPTLATARADLLRTIQ